MFVGMRMTRTPITVTPEDTLLRAGDLLRENRIHHLPVVTEGNLVGIVTGSDLRNFALKKAVAEKAKEAVVTDNSVGDVMTREVITVTPADTIEDALLLLHRRRFGALPVVEGEKLVGIITKADILAAFIDTLRIEEVGVRIEVILPQSTKAIQKMIETFGAMDLEVKSLIISPHQEKFAAFVRISTIDVAWVRKRLREAGFSVPEPDHFLR